MAECAGCHTDPTGLEGVLWTQCCCVCLSSSAPCCFCLPCREEAHAATLRQLAPSHRVRPSLLSPALRAGFWALGAAAAVAPRPLSAAVTAGMQDALTDVCNEQLRQLREAGLADSAPEVRAEAFELGRVRGECSVPAEGALAMNLSAAAAYPSLPGPHFLCVSGPAFAAAPLA